MELLALYDERWVHLGTLDCYSHECPEEMIHSLWTYFYGISFGILAIAIVAWRRVFRRFTNRPWMDPNFTEYNRLPVTTSNMRLHQDEESAREAACRPELVATASTTTRTTTSDKNDDASMDLAPNVWNMDGEDWTFQLRNRVERALDLVYREQSNKSAAEESSSSSNAVSAPNEVTRWQTIPVPANWTMLNDVPDNPVYTNIKYPFPCIPPFVPDENPTGVYKLGFDLPAKWQDGSTSAAADEYTITFHGVESAFFLFVNNEYVGYSQDSRLPASFDLTPHLSPHGNVMYVVVCRWSDGSYLEDQDHWWMAGIHRSVELVRRRRDMDILDFRVQADMDGHLAVCVDLRKSMSVAKMKSIRICLFSDEQQNASGGYNKSDEVWTYNDYIDPSQEELKVSTVIPNPKLWSAEIPNLYTLVISLEDRVTEKSCQVESCRIGFRTVDIHDGILLFNGKSITICGVNRHEHDPDHGKVVSIDSMVLDIEIAKRNNFNAIRTSHYPNAVPFYRLCDYYGIYVCDEANLETHGKRLIYDLSLAIHLVIMLISWPYLFLIFNFLGMMPMGKLADDFSWAKSFVERVTRMVNRDRNHASIIFWSLGNECGRGRNLKLAREALRELDTSRPIMYEGGGGIFEGTGESELTDIICSMYPSVERTIALTKKHKDRPVILCEYRYVVWLCLLYYIPYISSDAVSSRFLSPSSQPRNGQQ